MAKFNYNYEGIRLFRSKIEKQAWGNVIATLDDEMDAVIEDPTEFAELGFINQDIVDTGRLLNSKLVFSEGKKTRWEWDPVDPDTGEHYAAGVINGFYAYKGTKWVPGRDWVARAIERVNPGQAFAAELKIVGFAKAKFKKKLI